MKVLIVDNHEDGVYKCRGELIKRLLKEHEVYLSLPRGKYTDEMQRWGCVFSDVNIDRRGMNPLNEIKLIALYKKLLQNVNPDVVLTYSIKPNSYVGHLCAKKKIPYIANITGLGSAIVGGGLLGKVSLLLYRIGLRKAQMVFFQNEYNRDFMIKHHIVSGNTKIIPGSGVNLDIHCFEEYPSEDNPLTFITIGRLMKDKGTDELLEAARRIKKEFPDVLFNLIGFYDGEYQDKVEKAMEEGIVCFYGHQDDVHSFIKGAHATVHPSYHEGMANALLETASAGRPVIATNVPGCRETFENGITGIGFEPRSTDALVKAIRDFITLPYDKKVQMGKAARYKIEQEFDRRIVINEYVVEIEKIHTNQKVTLGQMI